MADEHTPLVSTVQVGSVPRRYPHQTVRRFCTVALTLSLIALLVVFLVLLVFGPVPIGGHHDHDHKHPLPVPPENATEYATTLRSRTRTV